MILDGTQPTLTQVPPMVPRSISVTCRALLDGLQCCRHRGPAAADHGDLQRALAAAALVGGTHPAARLVEQPSAVVGRRGIGEHRFVAQASHGGGRCVPALCLG